MLWIHDLGRNSRWFGRPVVVVDRSRSRDHDEVGWQMHRKIGAEARVEMNLEGNTRVVLVKSSAKCRQTSSGC